MKQILNAYFEEIDAEAFELLQFVVWLPIALLIWLRSKFRELTELTDEMKERAGRRMIRAALNVLPYRSIIREQLIALLSDRRHYERYEGWCEMTRAIPLSWDDWQKERTWVRWLQRKMQVTE